MATWDDDEALTAEQWGFYAEHGYVRLGRVMETSALASLRERINDIMLGRVRYDRMLFQLDSATGEYGDLSFAAPGYQGPTLDYRKIQDLEQDPLFLDYMQHPCFQKITRVLIGPEVSVYRAMFMNKPAGKGTVLPYHQDGGSQWQLDRERFVTVWTALDPATVANGCMEVIPGSHKLGLLSDRGHTITPEQEAQYCREVDSVFLEVEAGEAILLHNYLLHRSGVNRTEHPRRAFSVVYMDAATRSLSDGRGFPVIFGEGALSSSCPSA